MELVQEKLSNGNTINYKVVHGTAYHEQTPDKVVNVLSCYIGKHDRRVRVFYGDAETGRDWHEEFDTMGYIGRSTGDIKIPLMIRTSRSMGGGALLDHCIVKIQDVKSKAVLYQHPTYHVGEIKINECPEDIKFQGYSTGVYINGENHANFKTYNQAERFVKFLQGERMAK